VASAVAEDGGTDVPCCGSDNPQVNGITIDIYIEQN
jgi:hypothetical protein